MIIPPLSEGTRLGNGSEAERVPFDDQGYRRRKAIVVEAEAMRQ